MSRQPVIFLAKRALILSVRAIKKRIHSWRTRKKCNPKVIKEVLEIIPTGWLFAGTLLGVIREGRLIKWDGDIDIGCSCDDITDSTINALSAAGFSIKRRYILSNPKMSEYAPGYLGKTGKLVLEKRGTKIEICCFAPGKSNQYLRCEVMYYAGGDARFFILPKNCIYPQITRELYGAQVNIPANYEGQLAFIYGDSWREPAKRWYLTAAHYLCREKTIIELGDDDGTPWSKWKGRQVIRETYGVNEFPADINEPFVLAPEAREGIRPSQAV